MFDPHSQHDRSLIWPHLLHVYKVEARCQLFKPWLSCLVVPGLMGGAVFVRRDYVQHHPSIGF